MGRRLWSAFGRAARCIASSPDLSPRVAGQIAAGSKIVAGEKEVGEITSAASLRIASGDKTVALGYIRREVGVPGREVTIGAAKATVVQVPVADSVLLQDESSLEQHPA